MLEMPEASARSSSKREARKHAGNAQEEADRQGSVKKKFELLRLENQLCFALYAATRARSRTYRERLAPMGLTYPQYLVLTVLWEQDGVTVSEIGHRLMLDSGTLTPVIKRLETMELLLRKRSLEDEREVYVYIGPKGIALREEALEARRFVACRLDMTEQEIRDLRGNIMDLIGKLGDDTFRVCKAAE